MGVVFGPSSYQLECRRATEMNGSKGIDGITEKQEAFELQLCDTSSYRSFDPLEPLHYMNAAVIALCFSVAEREAFDMIKTKVRPYST